DVVADLGLHSNYASPFDPMDKLRERLAGLPVMMVGIYCDIETIMARRNADPQNGFYAAGPGIPAPVQRWQDAVHLAKTYHLELDMGRLTPQGGAGRIAQRLASPV